MKTIVSFVCGLIMSVGLILSGMIHPQKVLGFLDIMGVFDPTLAFVMAGALAVAMGGYWWAARAGKPVLCDAFHHPSKTAIDAPLLAGAALFGIGWGLAGFCPAPAIVGVGLGVPQAMLFVGGMVGGMLLAHMVMAKRASS